MNHSHAPAPAPGTHAGARHRGRLVVAAGLAERDGKGVDATAIAMLGVEWRFKKPVFFRDTIKLRITLASKRLTSRPDRGIIVRDIAVLNQHGEVVQEGRFTTMVRTRAGADAG